MHVSVVPQKPLLRGWLHLGTVPLALVAGLFLTANGRTTTDREAVAVFTATACLMFGTSAIYHRGTWSPKATSVLRGLDLANIALIIAGTYTPIALAILPREHAEVLLWCAWTGAVVIVAASILSRLSKRTAPRWLYTSAYVVLGWLAIAWFPEMWHEAGVLNFALIACGGILYTSGAVVYALKRPALSPATFGYHELFHACTVAGFCCHLLVVARVAG